MKTKFHIPTQQFGFLEIIGTEEDLPEMEKLYNKYAEKPIAFDEGFEKFKTFTGEEVFYDDVTHSYKDLDGNRLLSGSAYKKSLEKPFDLENISKAVGKKHDVDQQTIKDMWSHNSSTSLAFGNAIHNAMEQWFKFKDSGTEKEYHLPKHPYLQNMVQSFPLKDKECIPEVLVSDVKNARVGRIDLLEITGDKKCILHDYKSDGKIEETVEGHFKQLSFYAHILIEFGWEVEKVVIWNYLDEWKSFDSPVLELK